MRTRGYRKRRRHQKRKRILKTCFMTAFIIIFAVLLYTAVILVHPAFIVSRISIAYNNARLLLTNTIPDFDINIKISDTFLSYKDYLSAFLR